MKITAAGKKFIKNPESFLIVEDKEFTDEDYEAYERDGASSALDPTLYNMLKDLRKKVALKTNQPPYTIFLDVSLEQMATDYPITLDELRSIQGVGDGKIKKNYCNYFIELIKKHCLENNIERQSDLRVRTVAKKSIQKVSIIQSIATAKGMDFDDLLDEIEAIVYSGTKLNINYFLEDVIDEDHIDDIYEYFKDSETDDLHVAMEELGNDYDENEIRLVRIKFMSEVAD